ncbi:MAG: hypothetical protein ABWZ64_16615 [Xanthobacteraceae bacterium]|jgi:hypothetical protein
MPIEEADPWRWQYFRGVSCPPEVRIPTEDADSWLWYPRHRWVYDKLAVALSQGLAAGPHGTTPPCFPVFSKPMMNLRGMGVGSRMVNSADEYQRHLTPGHMWMTLLEGEHVSSDVAVAAGEPIWWRHVTGTPGPLGTFDYWTIHAAAKPAIERYCGDWIFRHLRDYTGMLNFETIGGRIIEVHLRFSDQWPDLYGRGWIEALIELYQKGTWSFPDADRRDGHSVVLFGKNGRRYRHPPPKVIEAALRLPHVSSVQITFHEDRDPEAHAMPPGGFRLAIVNAWDLGVGFQAREHLKKAIIGKATA